VSSRSYRIASRLEKLVALYPPDTGIGVPLLGIDLFLKRFKIINRGDSEDTDREILKAYGEIVQMNNLGVKQYIIMDSATMNVVMENMEDRSEERSVSVYLYEGTIPFASDVLFFRQ
jgi:hypothetical protein